MMIVLIVSACFVSAMSLCSREFVVASIESVVVLFLILEFNKRALFQLVHSCHNSTTYEVVEKEPACFLPPPLLSLSVVALIACTPYV